VPPVPSPVQREKVERPPVSPPRTYNRAMVAGVILAAGRSSRMGRSKSLLTCADGRTFVHALADALSGGGADPIAVVGRPDDAALREEVARLTPPVRLVINEDADRGGQLSSLLAGLRDADRPEVRGLLVAPVDAPLITAATVDALVQVFKTTGAPIVRARHRGRHGHPVIFARTLFDELRAADPQLGAKAVLRAHAEAIRNVEVEDDPGVLGDIDTPEDYRAAFGSIRGEV
jgi:molybdenum cofactor cytidylyltransferase